MAVANVVAKFTADISDVQAKMATLQGSLTATGTQADALSAKMQAVGTSMSSIGKTMTVGMTLPLVAIGAAATKMASDFDTSMTKIVSLVGISADEVNGMKAQVLELSTETGKSAQELSEALFVVTSAGLRGEDAMNALEASSKAGAAGLGETADIARSVAGALNAYGPSVLDAARATDIIVATARAGNFETSQFAGALGRVLPFAKQAGASLEDVGGAVALLTRTNGDAAQSVTQMTALFRAFVVPSAQMKKALSEAGLSASDMRDRISKQGLAGALQFLDEQLGGNREELGFLLGSSEAAAGAFQILEADAQTLSDTFGVVTDSVGMTNDAFAVTADTAGFKMQQAITSLQNSMIGLGDVLLPIAASIADKIAAIANAFSSLPGPVKTSVVAFAGVAAVLGPLLWVGGKIITMLGSMAGAWVALNTRIRLMGRQIGLSVRTMEVQIKGAMIKSSTSMGALAAGAKVMGLGVVGSFRTIGAAAKGLLASLGPVGLVIAGVSLAMEVFIGRSAEAEAISGELTDTVDGLTGSFNEAGIAAIAFKLRQKMSEEDIVALQNYGVSVQDMAVAIGTGGAALDDMRGKMEGFRNVEFNPFGRFSAHDIELGFKQVADGADMARDAAADKAAADKDAGISSDSYASATDGLTDAFEDQVSIMDEVEEGVRKISEIFTEMDNNVAAIRAKDEFRGYLRDINEDLAEHSRKLLGPGKAAQENRNVVLDALDKARADAEAWGTANEKTLEQVERRFQKNAERVKTTLVDEGFKQKDIETFFGADYVDVASAAAGTAMVSATVSIADRVGTAAFREFKAMGNDLADGVALGFKNGTPNITSQARISIRTAIAAAGGEAGIGSPSKVMRDEIGVPLAQGIEVGLRSKQNDVNTAMRDMIQSLRDSGMTEEDVQFFAEAGRDLAGGLADAIRGEKDNVEQASREAFVDWYQRIRGDLKAKLQDAKRDFKDFAKSVSTTIMGALDFGSAQEGASKRAQAIADAQKALDEARAKAVGAGATDSDRAAVTQAQEDLDFAKWQGEMLGTSFLDGLRAQAAQAVVFAERVKQLIAMNLSEEALQQVLSAGVLAGTAIADELIAGGTTAIDETNALVASTQGAADEVGLLAAGKFKQAGIDSAQATLNGFVDKFGPDGAGRKRLMRLMTNLANAMNRTSTITVTTVHRSVYESVGSIPGKAVGGPVSARQAYIVGERGPEVFVPGNSGNIIPNDVLTSPMAGVPISGRPVAASGGTTVNINVATGIGTDPAEVGRQVVEAIRKYERRSGPVFVSA